MQALENFDFASFWEQSSYADREYVDAPLTPAALSAIEAELGYRLPASYVALATHQNGGIPARTAHRTAGPTTWAADHIAISGIYAIGRDKPSSLCGASGSRFWVDEWGYPDIGIYFADCPSAGHDMVCLDYRACGPTGEPVVVHVDQEADYRITFVAASFEEFVRSLADSDDFEA